MLEDWLASGREVVSEQQQRHRCTAAVAFHMCLSCVVCVDMRPMYGWARSARRCVHPCGVAVSGVGRLARMRSPLWCLTRCLTEKWTGAAASTREMLKHFGFLAHAPYRKTNKLRIKINIRRYSRRAPARSAIDTHEARVTDSKGVSLSLCPCRGGGATHRAPFQCWARPQDSSAKQSGKRHPARKVGGAHVL